MILKKLQQKGSQIFFIPNALINFILPKVSTTINTGVNTHTEMLLLLKDRISNVIVSN